MYNQARQYKEDEGKVQLFKHSLAETVQKLNFGDPITFDHCLKPGKAELSTVRYGKTVHALTGRDSARRIAGRSHFSIKIYCTYTH